MRYFYELVRWLFKPVLRPLTRIVVGVVAIPVFRIVLTRIFRVRDIDDELEKDLEQWFRGSLLLLAATANMEFLVFGWLDDHTKIEFTGEHAWLSIGLRLLLAIGVIEAMPDQELFAIIHPGPPKLKPKKGIISEVWTKRWEILKGVICQHLNRLSPVLAIMAAIFGSRVDGTYLAGLPDELARSKAWERFTVGWCCYFAAISQYLVIGLVTSRDKVFDVLNEFDRAVAERRRDLIEEFDLEEEAAEMEKAKTAEVIRNAQQTETSEKNAHAKDGVATDGNATSGPAVGDKANE